MQPEKKISLLHCCQALKSSKHTLLPHNLAIDPHQRPINWTAARTFPTNCSLFMPMAAPPAGPRVCADLGHELHLPQVVGQNGLVSHTLLLNAVPVQLAQALQENGVVLQGVNTE